MKRPYSYSLIIQGVVILIFAGVVAYNSKSILSYLNRNQVKTPTPPSSSVTANPTPMPNTTARSTTVPVPQGVTIDVHKKYSAILHTTKGDMTVELAAAATPKTVNNFVYLARLHFYDNTIFHRVIKGFMIQGGDPQGNGMGGPGYRFNDEPFTGEYTQGTIAMANAGPNTNGSQFFIMHATYPLPKNYVIFGKVTKGLEVVDAIATSPVTMSDSGENSKPLEPVTVTSVEILEQ